MTVRHIAVCGMSFSGSTVLSLVLGTAEEVCNIGESHWIVDAATGDEVRLCTFCADRCPHIDAGFREWLRVQPDWYPAVGEHFRKRVVVSADKSPDILARLAPRGDFHRIIVYKHPLAAWHSHRKYLLGIGDSSLTPSDYGRMWVGLYRSHFEAGRKSGDMSLLNFHDWTVFPARLAERALAKGTGRPHAVRLDYWNSDQHPVGGNFSVARRKALEPERLPIRHSPPPDCVEGLTGDSPELAEAMALFAEFEGHRDRLRP